MRTTLYNINGSGGAFTAIRATKITRRVEIVEDGSANAGVAQGLSYQFDDGQTPPFTTIYQLPGAQEPLILGEPIPQAGGYGSVIGKGPQTSGGYSEVATLLCNLRSLSATATVVRVTEFD
ncbi:MAG: hypothetical protein ACJ71S_06540 [Acidobacteriaceae bacterium]|jgi:hypothetical protein